MDPLEYQPIAEIAVEEVRAGERGFTLTGRGRDRAQYRLGLRFEMPLDSRTRSVLGELLSQAELTITRRTPAPRGTALRAQPHRADRR
jgi:hypothetical protein